LLAVTASPLTPQATQLQNARASLTQTIENYQHYLKVNALGDELRDLIKTEIAQLTTTREKLDSFTMRIAVFGLVSRGKSAVLNALVGDRLLEVGPLNGVTQAVTVLKWQPSDGNSINIEFLDTPGLDEVDGQTRAVMAQEVAAQSDLILFIIAGEMTRLEYESLCNLRSAQKPLILVFNKIDLYPDATRDGIYQNLVGLGERSLVSSQLQQLLTEEEIALIAADPAPTQIRMEYPDGRVEYEWEKPEANVSDLNHKLLNILHREGRSLLALNALTQSRSAELKMAEAVINNRQTDAEALIWKFVRYKAIGIGLNPFGFVDFFGGVMTDLVMIRELSKLYSLPMTRFEAGNLLKTILLSSGGLLLSELFGGIVLGFGKGWATLTEGTGVAAFGVGAVQAGVAAFGSYTVGRAAQVYLEQGCTWGEKGSNTVIREILGEVDRNTIIYRIREELM
jgi:uncharacterized protein